jgi:Sugar-transfer associated ATP-grasp
MKFQTLRSHIVRAVNKSLDARRIAGKPVLSQLIEILRLRFSEAEIRPDEYYNYELYNDHLFSFSEKLDFVGGRAQAKLYARLNSRQWSATARDKILFDTLMRGLGVRIPKLYAVYSPTYRMLNDVPCITELNAMTDFIQNKMSYPFFAKPIRQAHGVGAIAVNCFNPGNNTLLIRTGEQIRVHDFVTNLFHVDKSGYLFQECLAPHPAVREICGASLSTIRMIVFLSDDGPHLLHAIWRIPCGSNMTDSFAGGTTGNLFGRIAIKTGRVVEVVQSISPYRSLTEVHPDSGKRVTGVTLPNWEESVRLCLDTATSLPELRLQSWDVAMCPDGPLLIEVNDHGILRFVQYACRAGFRNKEFRRCLAS